MRPIPTAEQRDRALGRLKVLGPAQAIRDPELNKALAAFRGHPPTAMVCGNASCTRPFLWCALDPGTARVRFSATGPPGEPVGGPLAGTALAPSSRRAPSPYDIWTPDEEAGSCVAQPGDPMLRWRFHCPRCDRPCVLGNDRMITLILRALVSGRVSVRPAAE